MREKPCRKTKDGEVFFSTNIDKRSTETVRRRKKHIKIKIFLRDRHVLIVNGAFDERNEQNSRQQRVLRENRIGIP